MMAEPGSRLSILTGSKASRWIVASQPVFVNFGNTRAWHSSARLRVCLEDANNTDHTHCTAVVTLIPHRTDTV